MPSAAVIKKVRQAVRAGEAIGEQGVDGVGGRKKVRKIKFVLAEAYREIMRRFLKEAEAISLHQDARAGYLMMRFQASDVDMNKMIGLLGIADIAKEFRPSANGIKDATHVLIDRFWTPSYHNPYPRRGAKGKLKKRSRQQMALKVRFSTRMLQRTNKRLAANSKQILMMPLAGAMRMITSRHCQTSRSSTKTPPMQQDGSRRAPRKSMTSC